MASEYEAARAANVKKNNETLARLGLSPTQKPTKRPSSRSKKRKGGEITRRSTRAAGRPPPSYAETADNDGDDRGMGTTQRRRVSPEPSPDDDAPSIDVSSWELMDGIDPADAGAESFKLCGAGANGTGWTGPAPLRDPRSKTIAFADEPEFRPNLTPAEVLARGSFGGGYFRKIKSGVLDGAELDGVWKELPPEWLKGINVRTHVCARTYSTAVNKYGVNCGAKVDKSDSFGLGYWEQSGWIDKQDPFGWFHWYTRFFRGRRSADDARQISRWAKAAGPRGRWKQNLVGKCLAAGKAYADASVSPVVRQTLQHWAYELTSDDFKAGSKRVKTHGAAYMPRTQLEHVRVAAKAGGALKKILGK